MIKYRIGTAAMVTTMLMLGGTASAAVIDSETFESYGAGAAPAPWTVTGNLTVVENPSQALAGQNYAEISATAATTARRDYAALPSNGTVYLEWWTNVNSNGANLTGSSNNPQVSLFNEGTTNSANRRLSLVFDEDGSIYISNRTKNYKTTVTWTGDVGVWVQHVLELNITGATGTMSYFYDGVEASFHDNVDDVEVLISSITLSSLNNPNRVQFQAQFPVAGDYLRIDSIAWHDTNPIPEPATVIALLGLALLRGQRGR